MNYLEFANSKIMYVTVLCILAFIFAQAVF